MTEKVFVPAYSDPKAYDSVLNAFIKGVKYNKSQEYSGRGVIITFEWTGPSDTFNISYDDGDQIDDWGKVKPSVLYDTPGWRAFIQGPINQGCSLRVKHIFFYDKELLSQYLENRLINLLPKSLKNKIMRSRKLNFFKNIRKLYHNKNLEIQIGQISCC